MRAYLVRHPRTSNNQLGLLVGHTDPDIDPEGERQASRVAGRLSSKRIDAIYSSALRRSRRLAQMIAADHGLEVLVDYRLNERFLGAMENQPPSVADWGSSGAEPLDSLMARVSGFIYECYDRHRDGTVVIVTHGGPINAALAVLRGEDSYPDPDIHLENTSVSLIDADDEGFRILSTNDTGHLQEGYDEPAQRLAGSSG